MTTGAHGGEGAAGPVDRAWVWLGWATVVVALACLAATPAVEHALQRHGGSIGAADSVVGQVVWLGSWLGFPVVGAIVVHRRPRNRVGRLLIALGATSYVGFAISAAAMVSDAGGGPRWLTVTAAVLAPIVYSWLLLLVPMLLARFPAGEITSPLVARLRPVAVGAAVVVAGSRTLRPGPLDDVALDNPMGLPVSRSAVTAVLVVATVSLVAFGVLALVDLLRRWRRSTGVERAQLRWFMAAGGLFPVLWVLGVVVAETTELHEAGDLVILAAFFLGFVGMAAAIGVAVLRYRLYEIDRLVSRTVTYALVTAVLVAVYAGSVLALRPLLDPLTGGSDIAVAGSTLVVAALFGPVRRHVQAVVDHRFNRQQYDAARAVEAFGQRLRDEVDLQTLGNDLRTTVAATIQPATVSVWLTAPEEQQ